MLLDQNWAQEDVGPDLSQNCLTLIRGILTVIIANL